MFLLSLLAVSFSILSLMLLEPFIAILFHQDLSSLSPIGAFVLRLVSHFVNVSVLTHQMAGLVLMAMLFFFFKNFFTYSAQWLMATVRSDVVRSIRNEIFYKVLILPLSYFSDKKKGDVISRAVNDTHEIEYTILASIRQYLTEPITVVIYLVALFLISAKLSLFVLVLLPVAGVLISAISHSLRHSSKNSKDLLGQLLSHVEETLSGLRIIKGFNAINHAERLFEESNNRFTKVQRKIYRTVDLASPMSEFLGITVVMVVLVFGGMVVLKPGSSLSAELFITYIALFSQIINPAKNVSTAYSNYRRGLSALDRVAEILDAAEVIEEAPDALPVFSFRDQIELKNLSFSYEDTVVLHDLNLTIKKGSMVALVGPSGAGKSTLIDLLPRFYDPTQGEVCVDGTNIKQLRIDHLRSLFAIVTQDVVLFNDTVYNNIAFGLHGVSKERIQEAAKVANIYDFIMTLPEGFETNIGDRGVNLSGGQRQRLSIARAVLRDTPILLLDEATSAMDTESERSVQLALDSVMKGRTSVVVAHRLSTIQQADCIYVMEGGKIVEQGTHEELMQREGKYASLVSISN